MQWQQMINQTKKNITHWIPINRIYWNFFAIHKHSFRNYRSYTTKEIKLERKE